MRIGEIAAKTGAGVQTIRFYERRGLLKPAGRLASGYRIYSEQAVARVRFIRQCQQLGYTLKEICELLKLREKAPRNGSAVRAMAEGKIRAMDEKIRRLREMKREISKLLEECQCNDRTECKVFRESD